MQLTLERSVVTVLVLMLGIVIVQSYHPFTYTAPMPPVVELPCVGMPIPVGVDYTGSVNEPWTCKVQCDDLQPRYILYKNGRATQCETPPGCNDYGEDRGITCTPPLVKTTIRATGSQESQSSEQSESGGE